MSKLFWLAFKNQWLAQMKKPFEFFSSFIAIILNNSFYLYGIYLLAILSIGEDQESTKTYLISTGMVLISWGLLNVFGGGLYNLGTLIETGELEIFLAKPRFPLFLVAISKSNIISIGEIIQGITTIILSIYLYGLSLGLKALISSFLIVFGFAGIVILIGSFSFFSSRGSQFSYVLLNCILTLSLFPVSRALQGREKWIFYLTPLLVTTTLPRLSTFAENYVLFLPFLGATLLLFSSSLILFQWGLRKYKSKNYIFINE